MMTPMAAPKFSPVTPLDPWGGVHAAVDHRTQVLDQRVDAHAQRGGRLRVGLGDDGKIALRRADHGAVEVVVGLALELRGLFRDTGGGERVRVAGHLEVHADLEELERGQLADRLGARELLKHVEGALQPELRVLLDGDREPHVEGVVAQVVVRHARVRVDDLRRPPRVLGVDARGDEHRAVAERARVEDRGDLADDPRVDQLPHAGEDAVLWHLERLRDRRVRARLDRERALHRVEQPAVEVVERDGRAALAAADLRRRGYV